ncbi:MAG: hypothetical protein R3195_18025 [Gemmatimonadota bacterium]|nr:hypothetical protein [Gemmatimonadota bacterium]
MRDTGWRDEGGRVVLRYILTAIIPIASLGGMASALHAQATKVLVRVTAKDAKIIGSGVGGAHVTIRDAASGAVLAEGVQEGSTGDTPSIMGARERGATVFDTDGAAGFLAELDVREPTRVLIEATAPLGTDHAVQSGSKSLLVVPGRDITGEGVIIELNGFTVEVQAPEAGRQIMAGEAFDVRARVTMLCGCPTEPGGMWDSSDYEILLRAVRDQEIVGEWPMEFSGTTSEYTASARLDAPGEFELQVLAIDTGKGNTGMATRRITVR